MFEEPKKPKHGLLELLGEENRARITEMLGELKMGGQKCLENLKWAARNAWRAEKPNTDGKLCLKALSPEHGL